MAIAFAGTAPFGAAILKALIDGPSDGRAGLEVALVISQPDKPAGRGKRLQSPPVAQLANERSLRLVQPEKLHSPEMLDLYDELGIDVFIVTAFGQMVREPLLSNYLMLNVHGSILPAYRGAAPVERAIMDGKNETGVAIMQMEAGLDTGPVARELSVPIHIDDDAGTIFSKLEEAGGNALFDVLEAQKNQDLTFTPQTDDGASYAHKIVAADRHLNPNRTSREFHDQVRALSPHIGAWFFIDEQRIGVWKTALLEGESEAHGVFNQPGKVWHDKKRLIVGTKDGAVKLLEVQPPGKKRMDVDQWLHGLRDELKLAIVPEV